MRKEYLLYQLNLEDLLPNPFKQFEKWFEEAVAMGVIEPNAMSLATATKEGKPACRTVLMKHFGDDGLVFYTNYESRKARELDENPQAAVTFLWHNLERQVCLDGRVEKVSEEFSSIYFSRRERGSQLSAWTSPQDQVITSRKVLEKEYARLEQQYKNKEIPKPPFWGGFRLIPVRFEFWQGRLNRLHDRFCYTKEGNSWRIDRLAP